MLFLINLGMDFLSLYLTAKLTHRRTKPWRMLLAAVLGGLYGVLAVIFPIPHPLPVNAGMAVLLALIAFGTPRLLQNALLTWGSGALLGGIMSVLMAMGEPVYIAQEEAPSNTPTRYFILTFALALVFIRVVGSRRTVRSANVTVQVEETTIRFEALADSGNLLCDPLSGTPVIIASPALFPPEVIEAMTKLRDGGDPGQIPYRIRIIPQKTVNGEGILCGFLPEEVTVDGVAKEAVVVPDIGALSGKSSLSEEKKERYGGYSGIVPASLC